MPHILPPVSLFWDFWYCLCSFFVTIVWYMQKEIFQPIADLFWVSRKIHSGDFRARAEYNTNSYEMEEVKQAYNDMVQTILEMRVEKYEQELRMKDVQLKYIHMQLKPHYFLNALSTINSMVYQHEEENVHTFIQAFSQNIRYMFRTGLHTVPLQDEIKNCQWISGNAATYVPGLLLCLYGYTGRNAAVSSAADDPAYIFGEYI